MSIKPVYVCVQFKSKQKTTQSLCDQFFRILNFFNT